jgi:hypothetical protein
MPDSLPGGASWPAGGIIAFIQAEAGSPILDGRHDRRYRHVANASVLGGAELTPGYGPRTTKSPPSRNSSKRERRDSNPRPPA